MKNFRGNPYKLPAPRWQVGTLLHEQSLEVTFVENGVFQSYVNLKENFGIGYYNCY
jgi:hypothetical protein